MNFKYIYMQCTLYQYLNETHNAREWDQKVLRNTISSIEAEDMPNIFQECSMILYDNYY